MVWFRMKWRHHNRHNETTAMNRFHINNINVGKKTYGPIEVLYDSGAGRLSIGNYCSIAKDVKFFLGGGHDYRRISTFPFQSKVYSGKGLPSRDENLDIVVEDDVWIGYDCIVLPGTHIGKGCVIGARSVVTGTLPPYSVYVVNKVIKQRFGNDISSKLISIDFSKINHSIGDQYEKFCTEEVNVDNVERIIQSFIE